MFPKNLKRKINKLKYIYIYIYKYIYIQIHIINIKQICIINSKTIEGRNGKPTYLCVRGWKREREVLVGSDGGVGWGGGRLRWSLWWGYDVTVGRW